MLEQTAPAQPPRPRAFAPIVAPRPRAFDARPEDPALLEGLARVLEESGSYRVLRRLAPPRTSPPLDAPGARLALLVDVETTGLDPAADEVIELACLPFSYTASGRVLAAHQAVIQLREPSRSIPPRVAELTGLDDDAVRGRTVDEAALAPLLAHASLVVAHNARFDRPFLERLVPAFADVPWACTLTEVPWDEEGVRARTLTALAAEFGFFYDAHRAADDCHATLELLGRPLLRSGATVLAGLLRRAEAETSRVWATGAPYGCKDLLRRRGYRWSNGSDGRARAWFLDLPPEQADAEVTFLRTEVLRADAEVPVTRLTAYERHSERA